MTIMLTIVSMIIAAMTVTYAAASVILRLI